VSHSSQDQPVTPEESWHYIHRFLIWLVICFGAVTGCLLLYNQVYSAKSDEAAAALTSDADAAAMKSAFELLRSPHLFSGWRVPNELVPGKDPRLSELTEDGLLRAALELPSFPAPKGSVKQLKNCQKDTACIIAALGAVPPKTKRIPFHHQLYRYLYLSRAMSKGEALSEKQVHYFRTHLTLWVRAFERQIVNGKGSASHSDRPMLSVLLESRQISIQNTWIFCWYGIAATLLLALVLFLWRRRRPSDTPESTDS
jgi:hypothetical protein